MPITLNGDGAISGLTATGISAAQTVTSVPRSALPTGSVLQVVNVITTTSVSTTSASLVTTGFFATITPTSASSRILVLMSSTIDAQSGANVQCAISLFRNATNLNAGGFTNAFNTAGRVMTPANITFLDSPATTSATTYTIHFASANAAGTVTFNQGSAIGSELGTLILMEIAA